MHTCTRTLTPARTQPHTPATPLPSRMFSCSRAPQRPSTEGSVLKCGGLCFLTCGTAGASCNPGGLRRGRARAAGCSVSKRASLPPLYRLSEAPGTGGMRTSPSPGGSARPRGWTAFLRGPSSRSFIGQTRTAQTLVHRIPLTLPGSLPTPRQVSEDLSTEKLCADAGQAGSGSWLKYIRVACSCDDQNLTMCQINEQVGAGRSRGPRSGPG